MELSGLLSASGGLNNCEWDCFQMLPNPSHPAEPFWEEECRRGRNITPRGTGVFPRYYDNDADDPVSRWMPWESGPRHELE